MSRKESWKRPSLAQDIELEPPAERTPAEDAARWLNSGEADGSPIPEKPLHVCPNCDYNLTGLTSRRCPECGEEFALHDARFRAKELGELGREMRAFRRKNALLALLGIVMGGIGLAIPSILVNRRLPSGTTTQNAVFTLIWFAMLFPIAIGVVSCSTAWRGLRAVFVIGALMLLWGLAAVYL